MNNTALHIDNISVYYGNTPALTKVCLDVADGEYLGIIGPNGSGKSTLLKAVLGLVPLSGGAVQIYGENPAKRKTAVGYVPQSAALYKGFPITLLEVVLTGKLSPRLAAFFRYTKSDRDKALSIIESVGLLSLAGRQISELSGGEFQKMLIARALAVNPRLLLLDEPTASVDAASRDQIYALLAELNERMTIILVTHDLLAVSSQVHSLACLNGRLIYHGRPELTRNIVDNLYGCPVDLIAHGVPHRVLGEHEEENDD